MSTVQHWTGRSWEKKQSSAICLFWEEENRLTEIPHYGQCTKLAHLTGIQFIFCLPVVRCHIQVAWVFVLSSKTLHFSLENSSSCISAGWLNDRRFFSAGSCILFHLLFLGKWTSAKLIVQLDAMLDVGRCRGLGKSWHRVCPVLLLLLSLLKESFKSVRSHHFQATLGTNSSILLPAQNASFPSPFSTSCISEMQHLPHNQRVTQL